MCLEIKKEMKEMHKQMLAKRIANLRKSKGFSQAEIAKYLGVSVNTIQRYESGSLNIPVAAAVLIAEFFNTDLNSLTKAA